MEREKLLQKRLKLQGEIIAIREQVETAKTESIYTGRYADRLWWQRAHTALRAKGRQICHINTLLGSMKHERHQKLEFAFIDVAREKLPDDEFNEILKEAIRRVERVEQHKATRPTTTTSYRKQFTK